MDANPELESRDHWSLELFDAPMKRLHGCVALILSESPFADGSFATLTML